MGLREGEAVQTLKTSVLRGKPWLLPSFRGARRARLAPQQVLGHKSRGWGKGRAQVPQSLPVGPADPAGAGPDQREGGGWWWWCRPL